MADESVDFQTTVVATPPANTKVAVDTIAGVSYQRVKLDGGQTIEALTDSTLAALGLKRIEEAAG